MTDFPPGTMHIGRSVAFWLKRACRMSSPPQTTLVLRNLPPQCTQASIFIELERIGLQVHTDFVNVPVDYTDKLGKGVAFVNFSSTEHAEAAQARWQGMKWFGGYRCTAGPKGRSLSIAWAKCQGVEQCVWTCYNKYRRDSRLKPWIRPDKEAALCPVLSSWLVSL